MANIRYITGTLLILFIGCAPDVRRVGVIVGPVDGSEAHVGTVVPVESFNEATDMYEVVLGESGTVRSIPPDLLRMFESTAEADAFVETAGDTLGKRAYATVNALRVRREPDLDAEVVYRLRRDERVQLVAASDHTDTINGRRGRWYEVIAGERYRGWVFEPLLRTTPSPRPATRPPESVSTRAALEALLADTVWVSSRGADSFGRGGHDLLALRMTESGIEFADGSRTEVFATEDMTGDAGGWTVRVPDGSEIISVSPGNDTPGQQPPRIRVSVTTDDGTVTEILQPTDHSWYEVLAETERRREFAETFFARTGNYLSDTYGELAIAADGTVRWTGNGAVVPEILPSELPGATPVRFVPAISGTIADQYSGAITIDLTRHENDPVFLVNLLPAAVRLTWGADFSDESIDTPPVSPVVMYFERVSRRDAPRM